jgi:hypothetical protein
LKQSYVEWQTKVTGMLLAGLAQSKEGHKAMMKLVNEISMSAPASRVDTSGDEDDDLEWHERGSPVAENSPGSFERMMRGLGSGG